MTILFFFLGLMVNAYSANKQVHYEPETVELIGQIDVQTFPGAPNYESIKNGDEIERHYYLKLKEPLDVILTEKDKLSSINGESFYNVKILQLVLNKDEQWQNIRKIGEKGPIKIKGTLFQRHTGHHHSRVLLNVESLSPID